MVISMQRVLLLAAFLLSVSLCTAQQWKLLLPVRAYTVVVNPKNANTIYVGGKFDRVYRSFDGGQSFDTVLIGAQSVDNAVSSMHVCREDTSALIAAGWSVDGVIRSNNSGATWERVYNDSTNRRFWFVSEAMVEDPWKPNIIYGARGQVNVKEVYRSTDCGQTWALRGTIPNTISTRLCTIQIRPDSANILFIGALNGVMYRSDDSGATWRTVPINGKDTLRTSAEIPKIVFNPIDPQIGYAIVAISNQATIQGNGGVLKSTNGGASWFQQAYVDTSFWAVDVRIKNGVEEVFAGGFRMFTLDTIIHGDSLVTVSTDGGVTWTKYEGIPWVHPVDKTSPGINKNAWSIRWDTVGKRLYLASEAGFFVLDEPTSVHDAADATSGLLAAYHDGSIVVHRDVVPATPEEWAVYSLQSLRLASGTCSMQNEERLQVGSLPAGVYFIRFMEGGKVRSVKFLVP